MSIEDAEAVGAAFLSVAAQLRELCGIAGHPDAAVRAAKAAVQLAHIACRTLPGNAGDYLRAAMDSVTDAEAVLR